MRQSSRSVPDLHSEDWRCLHGAQRAAKPQGSRKRAASVNSGRNFHNEGYRRSQKLLGSLFQLRRAGASAEEAEPSSSQPAAGEVPAVDAVAHEEPLMVATLRDLHDTEAALRKVEARLQQAHEPVTDLGGLRHATAILAGRALAVIRRKAKLVGEMEQRILSFQAAQAQKEDIFAGVLEGNSCAAPPELLYMKSFMSCHIHHDGHHNGHPVDADKSDFESFVASFGLPSQHDLVLQMKTLLTEAADWWAEATLRAAENGAGPEELQRLFLLAGSVGCDKGHESLQQASTILGDRLAHEALARTQEAQALDQWNSARSEIPLPESAQEAVEKIGKAVKEAVELGAPSKHEAIEQARDMLKALMMEEKRRLAEKVLYVAMRRQEQDKQDAAQCEKENRMLEVGLASAAADRIEKEVQEAIDSGALPRHSALRQALEIAKVLRDQDGDRKRLAARQKRSLA